MAESKMIAVPNLVGLTRAAAEGALTGAGLIVGDVTSVKSATTLAGKVVNSNPPVGTLVSSESTVSLEVSSGVATGPPDVAQPTASAERPSPAARPGPISNHHHSSLKTEIDGYINYSHLWSMIWAVVYYLLRATLIIISACVAAKETLSLKTTVPVLSLLVAIGTALDTWLKTGERYKGHYTFNDKFIALYTDLELTDKGDMAKITALEQEFKKLISDYAVAVLPE